MRYDSYGTNEKKDGYGSHFEKKVRVRVTSPSPSVGTKLFEKKRKSSHRGLKYEVGRLSVQRRMGDSSLNAVTLIAPRPSQGQCLSPTTIAATTCGVP